jgi:hypothetical protein
MNKSIKTISITVALIGLGLYLWKKYKTDNFFDPNKLQEPLKSFYFKLKEKGYNPQTNPSSHPNPFVTFSIGEGENKVKVTANSINLLLIYADNKAYTPIKFGEEGFTISNKILSDKTDLFDGTLEIIENKSYKI